VHAKETRHEWPRLLGLLGLAVCLRKAATTVFFFFALCAAAHALCSSDLEQSTVTSGTIQQSKQAWISAGE
jgi:hypothetical protein